MIYPGEGTGYYEGSGRLNGMIILSLLAHILILFALIFSPSQSPPKWTFGPVYSVQLVSLPVSSPEKNDGAASLREITDSAPSGRYIMKKESIDTLPSAPIFSIEAKKKSVGGMEKALDAVRKNVQSAANQPVPGAALRGMERITPPAPGEALPSAKQGDAEVNAQMRTYYALIWSKIRGLWTLPRGIFPENIEVVIHAQILKDGAVTGVDFEKRSGNRYFDMSALRTVKKASPFPPLPDGFRDSSLEIGIRFHSSEFR
ncbi:MAG TPA: energy transducer TonB [Syntrophales bacterium]|nr:energy transducer TonB [Syntrophales bacterium]